MKKTLLIVAGIAALAAAGWSALWYSGRGEVASRLDIELARLAGNGFEVSHGDRRIAGFPLAYRVTYDDVVARNSNYGVTLRLPTVTGEARVGAGDELTIRMPAAFEMLVDAPAALAANGGDPAARQAPLRIEAEADDLVIAVSGRPGLGQTVTTTAKSLLLVHADAAQAANVAVELSGIETVSKLPPGPAGGELTGVASVSAFDLLAIVAPPDRPKITVDTLIGDLKLTAKTDLRDRAGLMEILTGGTGAGRLQASYQAGETSSAVTVEGGGPKADGTMTIASKTSASTLAIADNSISISNASGQSRLEILPAHPDVAVGGAVDIASLDLAYTAPIAPSETMSPLVMRLAIFGLAPDEALWSVIDAENNLVREPVTVAANLEGTARLTKNPAELRRGEAPPIAFGNMSIKELQINALGAEIKSVGQLEFAPPQSVPYGQVTLEFRSVLPAIRSLRDAGLMQPEMASYLELLSQGFTRPGETEDHLITEIELDPAGILINGMPIQ